MSNKNNKPFFNPFVGSKALAEGYQGKRILVLGNAHYCGACDVCGIHGLSKPKEMDECIDFTTNVVYDYLAARRGEIDIQKWMKTFLCFERALSGNTETTPEDSEEIWSRLLFANFIQTAYQEEWDGRYSAEDYAASAPLIMSIVDEYQPDYIIAWGKREDCITPWDYMPGDDWHELTEDTGYYVRGGKRIKMMRIKHPRVGFGSDYHIQAIEEFLNS